MSALVSKHLSFCVEEMLAGVDAALTEHALVKALAQLEAREARGEELDAVCGQALRAKLEREIAQLPLLGMRNKIIELQTLVAETGIGTACEQPANTARVARSRTADANAELRHPDAIDAFLDEFDLSDDRDAAARDVIGAQCRRDDLDRASPDRVESGLLNPPEAIDLTAGMKRHTAVSADMTSSAEVFDLRAYRAQSRTTPAEPEPTPVPKPKLRIRVQARTSQALALTSMALVCWVSLPPVSFGPAPLRAVEIAAAQVMSLLPFAGRLMAMGDGWLG